MFIINLHASPGKMEPGRKGLALSQDEWRVLYENLSSVSNALKAQDTEYKLALGNMRFVTVSQYRAQPVKLDLREYYSKDGEEKPGAPHGLARRPRGHDCA
jgi:Transcriptional Coactivator p15 (PC4)